VDNINGLLLSEDTIIAEIKNNEIKNVNEKLLPLYLKRTGDIKGWLSMRAIDEHRTNSRMLKKALRLSEKDDISTVLSVNAVTITDNYWFKEFNSGIEFKDVKFQKNYFDNLALVGDINSFNLPFSRTPELTNTGSFEKCWRLKNSKWWLFKQGNDSELFSELFISKLGKAFGFNMVEYKLADRFICCEDFTQNASVNFEDAYSLAGDNEDYSYNYDLINDISVDAARDYVNLIALDTLCFNMDRHTHNYGFLRDIKTGDILSLAPNFDNNIALISRGYSKDISRDNDKLVSLFEEFIKDKQIVFSLPPLQKEIVKNIALSIPIPNIDSEYVTMFIMNGYNKIQSINIQQTQSMEQTM
jgi:hypothetical protein